MDKFWDKKDELGLVGFVNFAKESKAVQQLINTAKQALNLPASGFDFHQNQDTRRELVEKIYNTLHKNNLEYDLNEYFYSWNSNQKQIIRTAEEIIDNQSKGTCLDLAIIFCAICCHYDLLPILILLDGHALAAVSLTHSFREWENEERCGQEIFWAGLASLNDQDKLQEMIDRGEYLPIECTSFARSESLSDFEKEKFRRVNGLLSFDQAIELGKQQIENKKLIFALDIPTAYNYWLPQLFRERLNAEAPKSLNNGKDLLKEIYVPLGLIERKKDAKRRPGENSVKPENSEFNKPSQEYEIIKEYKNKEFFDEILRNNASTKTKEKRLVIVGDPGGGKSTLLQNIANWILREEQGLPIWISLSRFNENSVINDEWLYKYLSDNWLRNISKKGNKTPKKWGKIFEDLLESDHLWLILDGADEMAVTYPLNKIKQQLSKGWADRVRVVLSCRLNLWEQEKDTLSEKFDIYRTLDFDYPEQVHQFINNWFGKDDSKAMELQKKLAEENRERLRELVKNPLRLALLCRIWQKGEGKLPDTKAGFYESLVENREFSFNEWNKKKNDKLLDKLPNTDKFNYALGNLARTAIDNKDYRFRLRESFIKQHLGSPDDEPTQNNEGSLFWWALKLGWLLHIGYPTEGENNLHEKVYSFFHPTFQEYFAATVDDTYNFFLPSEHKDRPLENKFYRIFEPQWREVILLWLGRTNLSKEQKQEFIQRLVKFQDGCGKFYSYRAYLLAAAGIAEFWECDDLLKSEIVKQIVMWSFGYDFEKNQRLTLPHTIVNEARTTLQQTQQSKVINALVQLLSKPDMDNDIRRQAAESLAKIDPENENAIATLIQLFTKPNVRNKTSTHIVLVCNSLGEFAPGNENAIAALVQLLSKPDIDDQTRIKAAENLSKIAPGNEIAINTLVQLLSKLDVHDDIRIKAAESLGTIEPGNEIAINALVQLLSTPDVDGILCRALYSLEKIGTGNENAIDTLVQLLSQPDVDDDIRKQVAQSLGTIEPGNEIAINALVQLLSKPDADDILWRALYSLEKIGVGNENAINALVQLLSKSDVDDFTRRQAVESLGKIGTGNENAIDALVQLLSQPDVDDDTRRQVAESLGKIDSGNENAIDALVQLLSQPDVDDDTRRQIAGSLGKIDPGNENAINVLVQQISKLDHYDCLQSIYLLEEIGISNEKAINALVEVLFKPNVRNFTRVQAAKNLWKIDPGNQNAINGLVQLLSTNDVFDGIFNAAYVLGEIDPGNENAINALVQIFCKPDVDDDIFRWAAHILGEIDPGNENAIDALVQLLSKPHLRDHTRFEVAKSLGKIDPGNENAINALVQLLSKSHVNDNVHWEEIRGIKFDDEIYEKKRAAESLGEIGINNKNAINALVQVLTKPDVDDNIRTKAAESLGKIDSGNENAINALMQVLTKPDVNDDIREQAADSLVEIGVGNDNAIKALVQILSNSDVNDNIRGQAAKSLGKIDTRNKNAINALVQLLLQPNVDDHIRGQAVKSLEEIDPENENTITILVQLLSKPFVGFSTRFSAAYTLEKIGIGNEIAINALAQLLSQPDVDDDIRKQAAKSLGKIGVSNEIAINALAQLLSQPDVDDDIREQAAESLSKIGIGNGTAVNALLQLLFKPNIYDDTLRRAVHSLGEIGINNKDVINALEQLLSQPDVDDEIRTTAAESLGKIAPGNENAINILVQMLSKPNIRKYTCWDVVKSLGEIGIGNEIVIDALVQLLSKPDVDNDILRRTAESLGEIGIGNEIVLNALAQLVSKPDVPDYIRLQAAESLEKIDPGNENTINALVQLLSKSDSKPDVFDHDRWKVTYTLEEIGTNNENMKVILATSKPYFSDSQPFSNQSLFNIIWHCSENLLYPDFYQAWQQGSVNNPTAQNFDMADLPQILKKETDKTPDLSKKAKFICIDGSKFIDRDNPATKIYTEMLKAGCARNDNGTPKNMAELQGYWDLLVFDSNQLMVLVFYENPTTKQPQGFSQRFLEALATFDGAICLFTEQVIENSILQIFSPNSASVEDVLNWIKLQLNSDYN